jgi:O-antigen ligase
MNRRKILFTAVALYTICVYGPMAAMSIGAGVTFAAFLGLRWKTLRQDLSHVRSSPLFWPTLVFSFSCIWSLIWAKVSGLGFYGAKPTVRWIADSAKDWHLLFPLILAAILSTFSDREVRKIAWIWFSLGVATSIFGIVQHYVPIYHPLELPDVGLRGYYHSTGMTGFHLSFASILAFPAMVSVGFAAVLYRREGLSQRTGLACIVSVLFFIANVFTYSKIAWLALPLAVLLTALIGFKGWPRYTVIAAIVAFGFFWGLSPEVRMRFKGTDTIKDRMEVWDANWEMIKEHPVFGVGWHHNSELSHNYYVSKGITGFESHAHNNFIDQWATTGLFGLLSYLWWCAVILVMSFKIYTYNHDLLWRAFGLGLVGAWCCIHLNGLTQANFWDAKVLHQIGWVTALTMDIYRRYVASGNPTRA